MRRRILALRVAALVAATSGCSFVAVRRPPPVPADARPECTQSRVAPVLDTAGALGSALTAAGLWGLCSFANSMQSWSSDPQHLSCGALLWGGALTTAAYTGSAVYGFRATGRCRSQVTDWNMRPPSPATPVR